jgi:hypothetical protein
MTEPTETQGMSPTTNDADENTDRAASERMPDCCAPGRAAFLQQSANRSS